MAVDVYKGYKIWQRVKSVYKHNPISGYCYTETTLQKGFYVSGPGISINKTFMSIKSAKEHIDFIIKVFYTPKEPA